MLANKVEPAMQTRSNKVVSWIIIWTVYWGNEMLNEIRFTDKNRNCFWLDCITGYKAQSNDKFNHNPCNLGRWRLFSDGLDACQFYYFSVSSSECGLLEVLASPISRDF